MAAGKVGRLAHACRATCHATHRCIAERKVTKQSSPIVWNFLSNRGLASSCCRTRSQPKTRFEEPQRSDLEHGLGAIMSAAGNCALVPLRSTARNGRPVASRLQGCRGKKSGLGPGKEQELRCFGGRRSLHGMNAMLRAPLLLQTGLDDGVAPSSGDGIQCLVMCRDVKNVFSSHEEVGEGASAGDAWPLQQCPSSSSQSALPPPRERTP